MSFAISRIIVTPMQRIVFTHTAADVEPVDYVATLTGRATAHVAQGIVVGGKYRSEPLYRPELYDLSLEAEYADPLDNQIITSLGIDMDTPAAMAVMLRQAIWDICFDGEMQLGSRPVYMIHDGYFRPAIIRRSDVPDISMPAVEIGMPMLRGTEFQSNVRKREQWRIPVRMLDSINKDNPDELGDVWLLSEKVQAAVDQTDNINLGNRGVLDKAWSWRVLEEPDQQRDRMSGLRAWLTVHVERRIGAVGR